ncbi:MAG TPA: hypothetical protein VGE83_05395, partial [Terracidiphilus sp.]
VAAVYDRRLCDFKYLGAHRAPLGVSTFSPETVREGRLCRLTCGKALPFRKTARLLLYLLYIF